MTEQLPFDKALQVERSPGGNRRCPNTDELKRNCKCSSCRNRRNRGKGRIGQRVARQALGLRRERWVSREANEETWTAALRVEVKAGGRMANPVGLRYDQMRAQSDLATAIGDPRPFCAVVKPDGWSDVVVMVKGSDLPDFVFALLDEWADSVSAEVVQ
jgi:hypothetical protein